MTRGIAAMIAAVLLVHVLNPAASALAQAAEPFPEVKVPHASERSHRWAYLTLAAGVGLTGASFAFQNRADDAYARYMTATVPGEITDLYDRAHRYDQLSTTALVGGQVLFATGIWMRFLRRGTSDRLALDVRPTRCALSLRF